MYMYIVLTFSFKNGILHAASPAAFVTIVYVNVTHFDRHQCTQNYGNPHTCTSLVCPCNLSGGYTHTHTYHSLTASNDAVLVISNIIMKPIAPR